MGLGVGVQKGEAGASCRVEWGTDREFGWDLGEFWVYSSGLENRKLGVTAALVGS